jgi:hypothetical protein
MAELRHEEVLCGLSQLALLLCERAYFGMNTPVWFYPEPITLLRFAAPSSLRLNREQSTWVEP